MKTSLFFIATCLLLCSFQSSRSQHYLVAFSDETDTVKKIRTILGTLCSDEEIPYELTNAEAYGKNQLHILSGKKRILIFTDTPLDLDLFYAFCNGQSQNIYTYSQSEMMMFGQNVIREGQIFKTKKKVRPGFVLSITSGEITIEYNMLTKTVSVTFDNLRTDEIFYKGPSSKS